MESIGVLLTCPMYTNLHEELSNRFNLFKLWNFSSFQSFSQTHANSIRALVCDTKIGADANTIDSLPNLEIVSTYSVGLDKIDLKKCREKGIRVANTPDVLTDDVADLAIALALAVFRKIPQSDGYVKNGLWKNSDYPLTTKFSMESIGVLLTCPMYTNLHEELEKRFNLFKLWNFSSFKSFSQTHANSVRALVCDTKIGANANTIDSLPRLEIVSTYGVGLDKIDLKKCREKGIRVANTPDVLTDDVADLAIAHALAVFRKIPQSNGYVKNGLWKNLDYPLTTKFSGKSVGIVGLGRIGSAIAKRAAAFGCPVSYHSRSEKPEAGSSYKYYPNILDLAANSQILVVACALTEETHHIVNREVIDALGPKGVIINIGRGPIIDQRELVSALVEGRLGGAGLDVFENEPYVPEELMSLENVVLTPHVGTDTIETCNDMADLMIANLEAHFSGKPLLTPVL